MVFWGTVCGQEDVREKPWFKHHFCEATRAWHNLQCAREEIEIATQFTYPDLSKYIVLVSEYRLNVNGHLRSKLKLLEKQGGTGMPLPTTHNVGDPGATADTAQTHASTPSTVPNSTLPDSIPTNAQDLITLGDDFQDTVSGASQDLHAVDWEDENQDVDGNNDDYHHVIGRIVNTLEAMDLESV
ncbi:uncharacterized protein EI90DRAFT_3135875 [Cantharellus anzutake]|uniref:uncharacterized protein n=1 Tax=Cantharellus anzutake TaxID=1750568 RepID=UPI001907712A|nr:uncharacterized protein EI90DRAFT_3135875 [Cantharellus anzutake]KAF8314593.1 hypothetical protein EI90DRAFT_3135875 [Cantharellus anzutake]